MKTIYYYGIDNNLGGMEVYAYSLIKGVINTNKDIHFHIISTFNDFAFKEELTKLGVTYTIVPNRLTHPFKYVRLIRKSLKNHNEDDIAQMNIMSYRNILLFHAFKKAKIKTFVVAHSTGVNNKNVPLLHKLGRKHYAKFGEKVAVSSDAAKFMFNTTNNVKIIRNAVDSSLFSFSKTYRDEIRNKYNVKDSTFMIGMVGRISEIKNPIFAAKVMDLLKNNKDLQLFLFGKEQDLNVRRYINEHHLDNVHIVGEVSDTYKLYSAFDLFLFPSVHEAAGIALYEALSNGLHSLTSDKVPPITLKDLSHNHVLKLDENLWVDNILSLSAQKDLERKNYIKDSEYELSHQINEYINLYE